MSDKKMSLIYFFCHFGRRTAVAQGLSIGFSKAKNNNNNINRYEKRKNRGYD